MLNRITRLFRSRKSQIDPNIHESHFWGTAWNESDMTIMCLACEIEENSPLRYSECQGDHEKV